MKELFRLTRQAEEKLETALVLLQEGKAEEAAKRAEEAYHLVLEVRDGLQVDLGLCEEEEA